jgi:phosphodiesterase/alkaline phosphatase D-like protein
MGAVLGQASESPEVILREWNRPRAVPTLWQGAVTSTGAIVKAKVPPGVKARLVVREFGSTPDPMVLEPLLLPSGTVVTFQVTGLRPATLHTYTLEVNGRPSYYPPGILRTFPAEGKPASFRFAFSSCARTGSESPVFDLIRKKEPAVFVHLGDLHYENISRNDPRLFRAAWDTVLASPTQGALYREVPLAYVWDDHDFGPNNADGRSPARAAARSVYREYAPHYPLPAGPGDAPIYQAFTLGRVRFILTDLRSNRTPSRAPGGKSLMGAAQKAWFKRELLEASQSHAVVFWGSSVPWIGDVGSDAWSGYAEERHELANFFAEHQIRNLCILCGDAHMLAADNGRESNYSSVASAPIPVLHGSSLDQGGSFKGGPYSQGYYTPYGREGCFGWVEVEDQGDRVTVDFTGRNDADEIKVALRFRV